MGFFDAIAGAAAGGAGRGDVSRIFHGAPGRHELKGTTGVGALTPEQMSALFERQSALPQLMGGPFGGAPTFNQGRFIPGFGLAPALGGFARRDISARLFNPLQRIGAGSLATQDSLDPMNTRFGVQAQQEGLTPARHQGAADVTAQSVADFAGLLPQMAAALERQQAMANTTAGGVGVTSERVPFLMRALALQESRRSSRPSMPGGMPFDADLLRRLAARRAPGG